MTRPVRMCRRCQRRPATTSRHWYCDQCYAIKPDRRDNRAIAGRTRPTPKERGYGAEHRRLRKHFAAAIAAGLGVCWRCGGFIAPDAPWDLGHDDQDRAITRGPEHRRCNRATAGRANALPPPARTSRRW